MTKNTRVKPDFTGRKTYIAMHVVPRKVYSMFPRKAFAPEFLGNIENMFLGLYIEV